MTPAAQRAQLDFVRLSAEEPSSLYFERFLREGFLSWPSEYRWRFAGLNTWNGVTRLKQSLRRLARVPDSWRTVLASRSLSLVQLAARCLFRVGRNILTTDLSWPTYQRTIEVRASNTGGRITTIALRENILRRGWETAEVIDHLTRSFVANQCDSIFLPAVDHLGIRVPVREIVDRIKQVAEVRFCLVDAAQAFCHIPLEDSVACADFIITGSHKWMGAYLPMGIGFWGCSSTREMIQRQLQRLREHGRLDDPLLKFTESLDGGRLDSYSETANLTPLFACAGAAADGMASFARESSPDIVSDHEAIASVPQPPGSWQPLPRSPSLCSRVVLLEPCTPTLRNIHPDTTRRMWLDAGSIVSAYPGGIVRLSIPRGGLRAGCDTVTTSIETDRSAVS